MKRIGLALLVGCTPRGGATADPSSSPAPLVASQPSPLPQRQAPTAGTHQVEFTITEESQCSQSWDHTTYAGTFVLAIEDRGRATAALDLRVQSIGGAHGSDTTHRETQHACRWSGTANETIDGLVVELAMPEPSADVPYPCTAVDANSGAPRSALALRCVATRSDRWPTQTLTCTPTRAAPWLLGRLVERDSFPLGGRDLAVSRYSDSFVEGELVPVESTSPPRL